MSWQNPLFQRDRVELIAQIRPKQTALTARCERAREEPAAEPDGFFLEGFAAASKAVRSGDEDEPPCARNEGAGEQEARRALLEVRARTPAWPARYAEPARTVRARARLRSLVYTASSPRRTCGAQELQSAAVECRLMLGAMVEYARGARRSQLELNACLVALGSAEEDDEEADASR